MTEHTTNPTTIAIALLIAVGCSVDKSSHPGRCFPLCPSFLKAATVIASESPCVQFTYPAQSATPARLRNTCFTNGSRIEDRHLGIGVYE